MTDISPLALRVLAKRLEDVPSLTALTAADTLRALAAEKEAARDARRAALEEGRKDAAAIKDRSDVSSDAWTLTLVDAAIRALIDSEPAPVVADGWKLVPVEPTPEMARALESNIAECLPASDVHVANWRDAYRAMLAAAPTPPEPTR